MKERKDNIENVELIRKYWHEKDTSWVQIDRSLPLAKTSLIDEERKLPLSLGVSTNVC